ncbi:MAG: DUF2007 domain-containing protein [Bacteroidales bacterium]|nr:DUF2007 domain-containing protein [Bacteroidales bacterium]
MSEHDGLKNVFTGSFLEASFIKSLLEENGIGAMVRNTMNEIIVYGSPENAGLVFVAEGHEAEAKRFIAEYLSNK